jgi:hypothetical protein
MIDMVEIPIWPFVVGFILAPFGIWKIIEISIWLIQHIIISLV